MSEGRPKPVVGPGGAKPNKDKDEGKEKDENKNS